MKLLLDACAWGGARAELERAGHDVTWAGDWNEDPGDEEILTRAHDADCILVTLDKDFGELAVVRGAPHSGIIRLVDFPARAQAGVCLQVLEVLRHFERTDAVDFARGAEQASLALDTAVAKIWAGLPHQAPATAADPLGRIQKVIAATAELRSESGRLSARRIAEALGLSLSQLATAIGRSRQSVWKTDDAEALQPLLRPLERIARLRAVLSGSDFRSWLNMANDQLDGHTPIELIRTGQPDVVADLAEDMLTGSPG